MSDLKRKLRFDKITTKQINPETDLAFDKEKPVIPLYSPNEMMAEFIVVSEEDAIKINRSILEDTEG